MTSVRSLAVNVTESLIKPHRLADWIKNYTQPSPVSKNHTSLIKIQIEGQGIKHNLSPKETLKKNSWHCSLLSDKLDFKPKLVGRDEVGIYTLINR